MKQPFRAPERQSHAAPLVASLLERRSELRRTCADTTLAQRWSTPESGRPAAWRPDGASLKSAWAVLGSSVDRQQGTMAYHAVGHRQRSGTRLPGLTVRRGGHCPAHRQDRFHALGSGPARALAVKEALFEELGYRDQASSTYLVLEVDRSRRRKWSRRWCATVKSDRSS